MDEIKFFNFVETNIDPTGIMKISVLYYRITPFFKEWLYDGRIKDLKEEDRQSLIYKGYCVGETSFDNRIYLMLSLERGKNGI